MLTGPPYISFTWLRSPVTWAYTLSGGGDTFVIFPSITAFLWLLTSLFLSGNAKATATASYTSIRITEAAFLDLLCTSVGGERFPLPWLAPWPREGRASVLFKGMKAMLKSCLALEGSEIQFYSSLASFALSDLPWAIRAR